MSCRNSRHFVCLVDSAVITWSQTWTTCVKTKTLKLCLSQNTNCSKSTGIEKHSQWLNSVDPFFDFYEEMKLFEDRRICSPALCFHSCPDGGAAASQLKRRKSDHTWTKEALISQPEFFYCLIIICDDNLAFNSVCFSVIIFVKFTSNFRAKIVSSALYGRFMMIFLTSDHI